MKIKDIIQTIIFVCCLIMIPIFGISYHLFDQTILKSHEVLEKSFTVTTSIFGGAATLAAAYIASKLFNKWQDQHNKQVEADLCISICDFAYISNFKLLQNLTIIEINVINVQNTQSATVELIKVLENLQAIRDEIITILDPKTHFLVSEDDYTKIFFPVFNQITLKTEICIEVIHKCIERQIYKNDPSYGRLINDLRESIDELVKQINSIPTLLKPYYKALN